MHTDETVVSGTGSALICYYGSLELLMEARHGCGLLLELNLLKLIAEIRDHASLIQDQLGLFKLLVKLSYDRCLVRDLRVLVRTRR